MEVNSYSIQRLDISSQFQFAGKNGTDLSNVSTVQDNKNTQSATELIGVTLTNEEIS